MSTERTYSEVVSEVGERMARLEGKLDTGLAEVSGAINTLNQSIKNSDAARLAESAELRKDIADHEARLREQDKDLARVATRIAHVEATSVTPKKLYTIGAGVAGLIIAAATAVANYIQ